MPRKTRISFQTDTNQLSELRKLAKLRKISITSLIENWAANTNNLSPAIFTAEKNTGYEPTIVNLRINKASLDILNQRSEKLGVSRSFLIRSIIRNNLNSARIENSNLAYDNIYYSKMEHVDMWRRGKLSAIMESLGTNISDFSLDDALTAASTGIEIGMFDYVENLLIMITDKFSSLQGLNKYQFLLIKADLLIYRKKYQEASAILDNLQSGYPDIHKWPQVLAKSYLLKASMAMINDNTLECVNCCVKILSLVSEETQPTLVAETYIILSEIHLNQVDSDWHNLYYQKARNIINNTENDYYRGWILNLEAMKKSKAKETTQAIKIIKRSLELHKSSGSILKEHYSYTLLTRFLMINSDLDSAHKNMIDAVSIANSYNLNSPFSNIRAYQIFLNSKYNYQLADKQVARLKKSEPNSLTAEQEYVFSTMEYLNGATEAERQGGETKLKKMANTQSLGQTIKLAASDTLHRKAFSRY